MAKDKAPETPPVRKLGRFVLTYIAPDGTEFKVETEVPPRFSGQDTARNLMQALERDGIHDA